MSRFNLCYDGDLHIREEFKPSYNNGMTHPIEINENLTLEHLNIKILQTLCMIVEQAVLTLYAIFRIIEVTQQFKLWT
ncbi:hypothetical protein KFK09_025970 [Dendrobium nobile]|uniref:Uncharacterized protein n=1 Tax=Dendrobium nobile TaxID=94219 RepID=A0A8T3A645_DENNO|nr:hypothetical protein KFK09_025970 [Dendrobium nobile]